MCLDTGFHYNQTKQKQNKNLSDKCNTDQLQDKARLDLRKYNKANVQMDKDQGESEPRPSQTGR